MERFPCSVFSRLGSLDLLIGTIYEAIVRAFDVGRKFLSKSSLEPEFLFLDFEEDASGEVATLCTIESGVSRESSGTSGNKHPKLIW